MSSSATPVALMIDEEVKRLTKELERAASLIKILDQRGEVKKLKEENEKLKEELKEEKEWEKQTGREEAIEEYEKVAYEMCESRLHANDPILMAGSAKCLNEENKKLKEEHTQYRMDIDELKDKLHLCKASHTRITEKLKEENEELKEQNEELYDYEGAITCLGLIDEDEYNKVVAQNKKLKEKNEKLKEENEIFEKANEAYEDILAGEKGLIDLNEELQQFALAVHNFAYGTEWDDEDIVSAMGFDGIIEKMKNDEKGEMDENKKLKEENKELRLWVERNQEEINRLREVIDGE